MPDRYVARKDSIGVWSIFDTVHSSWPIRLGTRAGLDRLPDEAAAQAMADKLNADPMLRSRCEAAAQAMADKLNDPMLRSR